MPIVLEQLAVHRPLVALQVAQFVQLAVAVAVSVIIPMECGFLVQAVLVVMAADIALTAIVLTVAMFVHV
jgi:hypothetical protein